MADNSADVIIETEGESIALVTNPVEGACDNKEGGGEDVTPSKGNGLLSRKERVVCMHPLSSAAFV